MSAKRRANKAAGRVLPKDPQPQQLQLKFPHSPHPQQLWLIFPKPPGPVRHYHMIFNGFVCGYERHGIFNREEIFNFLGEVREFGGDPIMLISQRYFLFNHNHVCVRCGLEGLFFAKERSAKRIKVQVPGEGRHNIQFRPLNDERANWHLNLYALKLLQDGSFREVLMTKDHIIPRAKGGKDIMSNYQTMCSICNGNKADNLQESQVPFIPPIPVTDNFVWSV